MERDAFDRIARAVAAGGSRRRLFGLGGWLALIGVLGSGGGETDAREHGRNRGHRPGKGKDHRKGQRHDGGSSGGGGGYTNVSECVKTLERACRRDAHDRVICRYANLSDINLEGCDLTPAIPFPIWPSFEGATLRGANLINTNLGGISLKNADLTSARLRGANLSRVSMAANWQGADLTQANLTRANMVAGQFAGADLAGAIYGGTFCPTGTNSNDNGGTCCGQFDPADPPPIGACPA